MRTDLLRIALMALALFSFSLPARADLTTDLQSLVTELDVLNGQLAGMSIDGSGACGELGTLNTSVEDYTDSIEMVTEQLSGPLTLTAGDMTSLDDLSNLSRSMADEAVRLSWEMRDLEDVQDLIEYRTGLNAMLRLSDDIGTMADRILEMADRILIMADNIGLMADRIVTTQYLQNSNIAATQSALLTTLDNMVQLSGSLSSIGYNSSLGLLNDESQSLVDDMSNVVLTETNMATELAALEVTTSQVLGRAVDIQAQMMVDSQSASHYINGDTLTLLGDLSGIHKSLAAALENYAATIEELAPMTDNAVLRDATASMLRLSEDIGLMSDRIMEMSDKIIVMADNIGLMSGRIVETQTIQQGNVVLTERSILSAQSKLVSTLQTAGL